MNQEKYTMPPSVLTIGHSTHPLDRFLALLARHEIKALVAHVWCCHLDFRQPAGAKHWFFCSFRALTPECGRNT